MLTHQNWKRILRRLKDHRQLLRVDQLDEVETPSWVSIKHDVESRVDLAIALAKIEHDLGIHTTYYIQGSLLRDDRYLSGIKYIHSLGHEVSIHYDVMDANGGSITKAIADFSDLVRILESNEIEVSTVCPHGNPIMVRDGWNSNKDFFRSDEVCKLFPNILDIVVHKSRIAGGDFVYISDAGYSFKVIDDVTNNDKQTTEDTILSSLDDLENMVLKSERCVISTHPHRWQPNAHTFVIKKSIFWTIKKIAVPLARIKFIKALMSRFYYVARKF